MNFEAYTAVVSTASSRPLLRRISRFGTRLLASLTNRQLRPLDRGLNDVALRRTAHKIKWVACDQGEGRTRPRLQHRNIVGADEDNLIHDDVSVLQPRSRPSLTLVTCYPFYFVGSAPQRYIVQASVERSELPIRQASKQASSEPGDPPQPRAR